MIDGLCGGYVGAGGAKSHLDEDEALPIPHHKIDFSAARVEIARDSGESKICEEPFGLAFVPAT